MEHDIKKHEGIVRYRSYVEPTRRQVLIGGAAAAGCSSTWIFIITCKRCKHTKLCGMGRL